LIHLFISLNREKSKAKVKISIAGCTVSCTWTKITDISIMATRAGYTVYAGGKGGPIPQIAGRIKRKRTEIPLSGSLMV